MARLTEFEFVDGILAVLALKGYKSFPVKTPEFDKRMHAAFEILMKRAPKAELDVRFRIIPDKIHGDSNTAYQSVRSAIKRSLIRIDSTSQEAFIQLSRKGAEAILTRTPGGKELFLDLADAFLRPVSL